MNYNIVCNYINKKASKIKNFSHKIKCRDNYRQWLPKRIFFRGESKIYSKTSNVASVYRDNYQESSLYHSYIKYFPNKFMDMSNYYRLTYMQHYGLPTCLLDITSNFLVALYFACSHIYRYHNGKDKGKALRGTKKNGINGRIWLILPKVPKSKIHTNNSVYYTIYNNYSDTIDILATLALFKTSSQHDIFNKVKKFTSDYSDHCGMFFRSIVHGGQKARHMHMFKKYKELMKSYSFRRFIHKIKQTNIGFQPNIDFNHLFSPKIVQPAITNSRIHAQQGYFILENYKSNNKTSHVKDIPKYEHKISKDIQNHFHLESIQIPNENKEYILRDLDINYGINRARLFPDYENVAKYVKNEFRYLK